MVVIQQLIIQILPSAKRRVMTRHPPLVQSLKMILNLVVRSEDQVAQLAMASSLNRIFAPLFFSVRLSILSFV
jgi:hypothetical protein